MRACKYVASRVINYGTCRQLANESLGFEEIADSTSGSKGFIRKLGTCLQHVGNFICFLHFEREGQEIELELIFNLKDNFSDRNSHFCYRHIWIFGKTKFNLLLLFIS